METGLHKYEQVYGNTGAPQPSGRIGVVTINFHLWRSRTKVGDGGCLGVAASGT